jgi:hypothetical protein
MLPLSPPPRRRRSSEASTVPSYARGSNFGYVCRVTQGPSENTTDDAVVLPWKNGEAFAAPSVLHFVVALVRPIQTSSSARVHRRGHCGTP